MNINVKQLYIQRQLLNNINACTRKIIQLVVLYNLGDGFLGIDVWALVFGPNRFFVLYSNLVKNGHKPLVPQGRTSQRSIEYVYFFSPTRNSSHTLRLLSFIFNVYSKMSHNILQQLNLVWWVLGTSPIDVGIYVVGYTYFSQSQHDSQP